MRRPKPLGYVVCPECGNKLRSDALKAHFKRAHKRNLAIPEMVELLSRATREAPPGPKPPKDLAEHRAKLGQANKVKRPAAKVERTPRSMRQWDWINCDVPMRSGPLGPG